MNLLSTVGARRALCLSSLLAALVALPGCISHVLVGGDGGDAGGGSGGAAGSGDSSAGNGGSGGQIGSGTGADAGTGTGATAGASGTGTSTGQSCLNGAIECDGVWVDTTTSPHNCGGCGVECGSGEGCASGVCVPSQSSCNRCASVITPDSYVPDEALCQDVTQSIYDDLMQCVCGPTCGPVCGDNVCSCAQITVECQNCVLDAQNGCGLTFQTCANDI